MIYSALADIVVVFHSLFVLFAVAGGLLVLRLRRLAWLHVPVVIWAALVELCGWFCPLTPLEVALREVGGASGYTEGFLEHYLEPILYPGWLTRTAQILLGVGVLALNVVVYAIVFRRHRAPAVRRSR